MEWEGGREEGWDEKVEKQQRGSASKNQRFGIK